MKNLHFEHGNIDGKYEDAYKDMLVESKASEQAAAEAYLIANYRQMLAQCASLKNQIERMEENPIIQKHLGKKTK